MKHGAAECDSHPARHRFATVRLAASFVENWQFPVRWLWPIHGQVGFLDQVLILCGIIRIETIPMLGEVRSPVH
jgi:hypothetical protein